jgi:hypothetical protein
MRRFGIGLILVGACAYYVCGQQLDEATPVPAGLSIQESVDYAAGRYEIGQYVAAMVGGIGLLLLMFPQGR